MKDYHFIFVCVWEFSDVIHFGWFGVIVLDVDIRFVLLSESMKV